MIKPKRLLQGGTIGIVAPAGKVDRSYLNQGVAGIEQAGFRVVLGRHIEKSHRYFAGTDMDRANDFLDMMQNKEIDAVFCARGGSGAARIIPYIDGTPIPPKILVGCSDITTLLLYLHEKDHLITFHGPMVATPSWAVPFAPFFLFKVLSGEQIQMHTPEIRVLKPGVADGILTGGCLTLICTTMGTPYEINTEGRILFIEDTGEAPYRIDRMLYYLKTLNKFKNIRGLVIGQMPDCQKESLPEMIEDLLSDTDIPVLFNFPSGHGDAIYTLPIGSPVRIDTQSASLTMLSPAVS
jgi:muramoyltetrapeptide carboxypeptidase